MEFQKDVQQAHRIRPAGDYNANADAWGEHVKAGNEAPDSINHV
jgi:hypothetical protein